MIHLFIQDMNYNTYYANVSSFAQWNQIMGLLLVLPKATPMSESVQMY